MVKDELGKMAKKTLVEFVSLIDPKLEGFWKKEIETDFGFNDEEKDLVKRILEHAREHNLRTGKRLRASFVYYGYKLANKEVDEKIMNAAMSVELVHTALLMHDDFMDQDKLRRGKPTTHEFFANGDTHYGGCMAVNVGDVVLGLGYQKLLESGFDMVHVKPALSQLLRGVTNTAYGQAYDVSLPKMGEVSSEQVLALHKAKTAIYTYENPLFIGAILGGLGNEVLSILSEYSMLGGLAFQIQDDILGVFGDEEKTGKSIDSDLLQGKVTLLITKTLEMGSEEDIKKLRVVWGNKTAKESDIQLAKQTIINSGSYQYSVDTARKMAEEAAGVVSGLRKMNLNTEAIDYLEGIARYMVNREV